jgi:hypothetical protein
VDFLQRLLADSGVMLCEPEAGENLITMQLRFEKSYPNGKKGRQPNSWLICPSRSLGSFSPQI